MRKRVAFTMLRTAIASGWSVPDEAIREGVDTALGIMRNSEAGSRDRIRAAELLLSVRQREADRLMRFVELEEEVGKRIDLEETIEGNRDRKEQKRKARWEAAGLDYEAHLEAEEAEDDIDFQVALESKHEWEESRARSAARLATVEAACEVLEAMPGQ